MKNQLLWGIDLGGTKIEGAVLSTTNGLAPVSRIRIDTEADKGYERVVNNICHVIELLSEETKKRPEALGLATPGVLDPNTNLMKNSNAICINGRALRDDLVSRLKVDVKIQNDANCFALAEALMGAAKGCPVVFGITLGTGVGGGLVINGQARFGLQGIAGEWGHNVLDPSGYPCYCGKSGCVEQFISGTSIMRYYESLSGQKLNVPDIYSRFKEGKCEASRETINRFIDYFGRAMATLINILDPDAIVVGGGVSNLDVIYTDGKEHTRKYIFNDRFETPILKNSLGDSAGLFGAALLHKQI